MKQWRQLLLMEADAKELLVAQQITAAILSTLPSDEAAARTAV
jgi:hypothetical protein